MSGDFTDAEVLAAFIANDLPDGIWAGVGANLDIPRAGVLLAHLTHAPNMRVTLSLTRTNLADEPVVPVPSSSTDWRAARWAESYLVHSSTYDNNKHRLNGAFFIGGMQVDRFGNTNLIGAGADHSRLDSRGPGGVGTGYMAAYARYLYLFVGSHNRKVFVPRCDFVSALGWRNGKWDRRELGFPGGGPRYCLTPRCVFDFEPESGAMRLKSVHPGHTVQEVLDHTGFDVIVPEDVPPTPAPTPAQLAVLRQRIDVDGRLRAAPRQGR
jgi:glutaconate CoA-transferase subunit B